MKYLLEQLKQKHGNQKELKQFCSYHVKTAFFHMCTKNPDDSLWQPGDLELCFDRCLEGFLQCLKDECLNNYFIPGVNLLSQDQVDKKSKEFLLMEIEYERNNGFPVFKESWNYIFKKSEESSDFIMIGMFEICHSNDWWKWV